MWKMEWIMLMCAFLLVTVHSCLNVCKPQDSGLRHFISLLVTFHDRFWHISSQKTAAPLLLSVLLEVISYFFTISCNQTGTVYWKQIIIFNICDSLIDTMSKQTSRLNSGSMQMKHNFLYVSLSLSHIAVTYLWGSASSNMVLQHAFRQPSEHVTMTCPAAYVAPVLHEINIGGFPALRTTSESTQLRLALCSASPHTVPPVTTALCFLHAVSKTAQLITGILMLCCHFTVTTGLFRHSVPAGSSSTMFLTTEL
jgi:hypothetical protein